MFSDVTTLPHGDKTEHWEMDVRSSNLSNDNLKDRLEDLLYATYDSKTIWPDNLPDGFNPVELMEMYKDPGLNVRELHKLGINGRGVGIAIIDQCLLTDHVEYKDNLIYYEESDAISKENASMHGGAVASIAVGKSVGVAPEADLYFFANDFGDYDVVNKKFVYNYNYTAEDINKIIEINKKLPNDRKIRVISISLGFNKKNIGYKEYEEAVKNAKDEGIQVISVGTEGSYIEYAGIGRKPATDANNFEELCPGLFWMKNTEYLENSRQVYIPMDFRCTASPNGQNDYVVYISGGMSWSVPYLSGLYALACQIKPYINFDEFMKLAYSTGKAVDSTFKYDGNTHNFKLNRVVSPIDLFSKIQSME